MATASGKFESYGIVGFGHFGRMLAGSLVEHGRVLVYDEHPANVVALPDGVQEASIEDVAKCDVVILAVPFSSLEHAIQSVRDHLSPSGVVMDVVSTKALATELLESNLPDGVNILATHPLFGPPSMTHVEQGQHLVVTLARGERAEQLVEFLAQEFGLDVFRIDPAKHDESMAYMQALPFFIARALVRLDILDLKDRELLALPSFEKLATIAAIEQHHTQEMFDTSQLSNPYAATVRRRFLDILEEIDAELEGSSGP
ncbi:MAG: prephenate dehydrogenase [Acidimicrobiia bacterium]